MCASGGAFTALAEGCLRRGGTVYGAAYTPAWEVEHRRVADLQGLKRLQSSKYAFSGLADSISQAAADLAAGREVLFSGLPCHIAAARQRLGTHPALTCVEVICHSAPEPEMWRRYLQAFARRHRFALDDIADINFRDKRRGWTLYRCTVTLRNGRRYSQPWEDNLYMRAMVQGLLGRDACLRCPFKGDASRADISVGDLWGAATIVPDMHRGDRGVSLVIARTAKGEACLQGLPGLVAVDYAAAVRHNRAVEEACQPDKELRRQFRADVLSGADFLRVLSRHAARPRRERLNAAICRAVRPLLRSFNK